MKMNQEIINFKSSLNVNHIKGVFSVDKLELNDIINYNNKTYIIKSITSLESRYYPQSNVLLFKIGSETLNGTSKIKTILNHAGLNNIKEFNVMYMNGAKSKDLYMYKELYYNSFDNFSIFEM
jgi:predicted AAA+ superfamily ATPase